jgi:hypothetical protein
MPWRGLSTGFFNPTGALFVVTTFSCSDGKFPSGVPRKTDRAADAASSRPGTGNLDEAAKHVAVAQDEYNMFSRSRIRWRVAAMSARPEGSEQCREVPP